MNNSILSSTIMKKLVPLFIILCLVFVSSVSLMAQTATPPSSGDGSSGNPYQIATLDNLYWLTQTSGYWDKNFIQTADINASATSSWADGFHPIGNSPNIWFTGNYDGDGHTISSLYCSHPTWANVGMFGIVDGSEIKDLTLSDLYVEGNGNIGGLAGLASYATISNVTVSGTVSSGSFIGGLIGSATFCTITYCSSLANVTGYQYTGGFIGHAFSNEIRASNCTATSVTGTTCRTGGFIGECENSQIAYCYSTANVVGGADDVGGFIGYNYESTLGSSTISHSYCTAASVTGAGWSIGGFIGQNHYGQVDYCYSTANVIATATHIGAGAGGNIGGLIGYNQGDLSSGGISYAEVSKCYSTGNVTATVNASSTDKDVGGFIGEAGGLIEDSYSRSNVSTTGAGTPEVGVFIANVGTQANVQYCYTIGDYTTIVGDYGFIYDNNGTAAHNFYDSELSSQNSGIGATCKTTAEMKTQSTFTNAGWDFDIWNITPGVYDGYPYFLGTTNPGGDGTEANPWRISNLTNLYWLSQTIGAWAWNDNYFIQTANIDASASSTWDGGAGFSPIGNENDPFYGHYDGKGYTISGIYINRPSTDYVGLFGFADDGTIKNIGVTNVNITGGDNVGGLIGRTYIDVLNCHSSGSVSGTGKVGGLIGYVTLEIPNSITNSHSQCNVSGSTAGGLIGQVNSVILECDVEYCYSTGSVSGGCVGGLVGSIGGTFLKNCYSRGSVSANGDGFMAGGLIGVQDVGQTINCYSTGSVSLGGGEGSLGGFAGETHGTPLLPYGAIYARLYDCYWDIITSGQSLGRGFNVWSVAEITGYATPEMKVQSNYENWDFTNIWTISPGINDGYPYLQEQIIPHGDGNETNPYMIATLENLFWLSTTSEVWDKHFIQIANIDASASSAWNDGDGMWPVGNTVNESFTGNYDGNGYTISSLTCSHSGWVNVGMFGIVDGSEIKDLTLSSLNIEGNTCTGALIGKASNATISNVEVSGTITGLGDYTGGLIGYSEANDISNSICTATSVSGLSHHVGGFIGYNKNSSVDNCYSTATVIGGADNVGGFIGLNYETTAGSATISDCYCTAISVTAEGWSIGGFIGQNVYGEVENCYSTANIISNATHSGAGAGGNVGGFIGYNQGDLSSGTTNYTKVSTCYSTSNITATVKSTSNEKDVGGFIGEAEGLIENCYSRGNISTNGNGTPEVGVFIGNVGVQSTVQYCYTTGNYPTDVGDYGFIYANSGTATHNFYDSDLSSQNSGIGATGKTTAEMKTQSTFTSWDFTNIWAISPSYNDGYPNLNNQYEYLWDGSLSEDWNTPGNWNIESIPRLINDIKIPANAIHDLIISSSVYASCNNLTIENGASLTIESNVSGTGSLIINGTLSNNGTISSQRYFPGATSLNWHMVSAPVASMGIAASGFAPTTGDFYAWDEPTPGTWVNYKQTTGELTFSGVNGGDNFVPAKGYLLAFTESNPTHTFSGSLNTGNQTFILKNSIGKDWSYSSGWNLMGNPYSSAIDWYMADKTSFLDEFAYAYDPQANEGAGAYVPIDGSGENAYISANQGFFCYRKI